MSVLVVSNSEDPTADYVQGKMSERGIPVVRFNTELSLTEMVHSFGGIPQLAIGDVAVDLEAVTGVWYRRPKTPEVPSSLVSSQAKTHAEEEAYYYLKCLWKFLEDRVWVSHPWAISWANVKLHQLIQARLADLKTPKSLATNNPAQARQFILELDGKAIVKPFKNNVLVYGDDTAVIYTSRVTEEDLTRLDYVRNSITFFQEEIDKEADVRVTVIGREVFAAEISPENDSEVKLDWRRNSPHPQSWRPHALPQEIGDRCLTLTKEYGLNFAAIDLALTPLGEYVFFELNPNGQWAWLEIELGFPMTESLIRILTQIK